MSPQQGCPYDEKNPAYRWYTRTSAEPQPASNCGTPSANRRQLSANLRRLSVNRHRLNESCHRQPRAVLREKERGNIKGQPCSSHRAKRPPCVQMVQRQATATMKVEIHGSCPVNWKEDVASEADTKMGAVDAITIWSLWVSQMGRGGRALGEGSMWRGRGVPQGQKRAAHVKSWSSGSYPGRTVHSTQEGAPTNVVALASTDCGAGGPQRVVP